MSCKLSVLLFHSQVALILKYMYSPSQSWRECNWRLWSHCTDWCSESEQELESAEVSYYPEIQTIWFPHFNVCYLLQRFLLNRVCSCVIIPHCSVRASDLTATGTIVLSGALQENKSLEELKWVVSWVCVLLSHWQVWTNSEVHVLSFTVLKLETLEPLHWLILWEWTRAWKCWSKLLS